MTLPGHVLAPSLLDRLIDVDLDNDDGPAARLDSPSRPDEPTPNGVMLSATPTAGVVRPWRVEDIVPLTRRAVRRDLEWLLNACRTWPEAAPELARVQKSLFHFGIRDFSGLSQRSPRDHELLRLDMQWAIETFEPRLQNVTVQVISSSEPMGGLSTPKPLNPWHLRFEIVGDLVASTTAGRVRFETEFDLAAGAFAVRET